MTHLLQPLDLTFFSSLKKKLSQMAHVWHAGAQNAGQALSKYSVMRILTMMQLKNAWQTPLWFQMGSEGQVFSPGTSMLQSRPSLSPWNPCIKNLLTIFSSFHQSSQILMLNNIIITVHFNFRIIALHLAVSLVYNVNLSVLLSLNNNSLKIWNELTMLDRINKIIHKIIWTEYSNIILL